MIYHDASQNSKKNTKTFDTLNELSGHFYLKKKVENKKIKKVDYGLD